MAINLWKRFEELIKPAAEEVVIVTAVNAGGTITGNTLTGGVTRARCSIADVAVGDRVFVGAGRVSGKAPSLPYYEEEI